MNAKTPQIAELRQRLAVLEGCLPSTVQLAPIPVSAQTVQGPAPLGAERNTGVFHSATGPQRFLFGVPKLDDLFERKGLYCSSLHEFYAEEMRLSGALSGFICAVLCVLGTQRKGAILWVTDPAVQREIGIPHAPGLVQFGMDPAQIVFVRPQKTEEVLWAMEEGAQCSTLCAVVGEVAGSFKNFDLTVTRRLALRAGQSGVPVFLVRHGAEADPSAALSRWHIAPQQSRFSGATRARRFMPSRAFVGNPSWRVTLEKNRDGRPGFCDLEWNHANRSFNEAPAHSVPVVRRTGNRPDLPAGSGRVVALRPHG
ncbi:inducible mutagenesis protein A [Pseudovibrio sp. Tun.PSC04-5.I4]|uniref:ImuA family protein n=1 Tax=Pseudovibrio sp. Tun.PSC04-5.I4 TaxID=1798213 RepID=UPI0008903551|nr:inducible mutagenesis protein A [Pseudovibrio sp. Tun.PSC04-5.I4]SDR28461.1 protein ImuA [Pseudovibrio sp. Tun.PSC04-5.I4]